MFSEVDSLDVQQLRFNHLVDGVANSGAENVNKILRTTALF